MVKKNYEDLEIYQKSYKMAMNIHNLTSKLPQNEFYNEGIQIRRLSKSIVANIVEGYGRRRYKKEFIKFLTYAHASCDETKVHLHFLYDSGCIMIKDFKVYLEEYNNLGRKIDYFVRTVEKEHKT